MRVAMVGPYPLDPLRIHGGVEAAAFYMGEALKGRADVELHIISATKQVKSERRTRDSRASYLYLAEPTRRIVPNMIANVGRLRTAIDEIKPDIVHANHPSGALAAIAGGYPTVFAIHAVMRNEIRYYGGGIGTKASLALLKYITNKAISRATHCAAVSSYVAREYGPIARGGITVIPNAVEDRFFRVEGDPIDGRMLYVGLIRTRKNVVGMVRAFRTVKQNYPAAELRLAGEIMDRPDYDQMMDYSRANGMTDSVLFLGMQNQEQLEKEHALAALICIFSWHETFSLTVAQGMAAGRPVVTSNCGGPSDLMIDGETGFLVDVGDEAAFAEKCLILLKDADLRRRMGKRAREVARERFSAEAVAKKACDLYATLLGAGQPRGSEVAPGAQSR